jgi:hypothetical protein
MSFWDFFKDKIFISYDYDHDRQYKNLLVAWAANELFSFTFYDSSIDVSVNSTKAGPVKRIISQRIRKSDYLLCIIGKYTYRSPWVAWEIEKAKELNIPLIGVKINRKNKAPKGLLRSETSWANTFKFESIKKALQNANDVF